MRDTQLKGNRPKPKVTMRPSDQVVKPRFDLSTPYKDGQEPEVQQERRSYERRKPGRFDDGVPVRRATLVKPEVRLEVPE